MAQYKNVLGWLETEYLDPAVKIARSVAEATGTDEPLEYSELKDLEEILEKALEYVRRHQR